MYSNAQYYGGSVWIYYKPYTSYEYYYIYDIQERPIDRRVKKIWISHKSKNLDNSNIQIYLKHFI